MSFRVLATGATGFIGGRLAVSLDAGGFEARCLVGDRGPAEPARSNVTGFSCMWGTQCARGRFGAARGIDAAYYLIHSIGRGGPKVFVPTERAAALACRDGSRRRDRARRLRRRPRRRGALGEIAAPPQPPRDGPLAAQAGSGASLLARRHGGRTGEWGLRHASLPSRAPTRDDRAGLASESHPADRDRRPPGVPGGGTEVEESSGRDIQIGGPDMPTCGQSSTAWRRS